MNQYIVKSNFTVEPLSYQSVGQLLVDKLETDSDNTCIIDTTSKREWTKRQVLNSALNFGQYLIEDLKVRKGDVVCFAVNNSDIHAIGFIGVLISGAIYCSFQEHLPEFEIKHIVEKTKPSLIVCSDKNYRFILNAIENNDSDQKILLIDKQSKSQTKSIDLSVEEIFEISLPYNFDISGYNTTTLKDVITFVMTSGSTGQPKVILKTNENFLALIQSSQHKEISEMSSNDKLLATGFCHVSGQRSLFSSIRGESILVINRNDKEPSNLFETIHNYEITSAFLIPTQLNFLAKNYKKYDKNYLKSLNDVVNGGAQISQLTYHIIIKEFRIKKFRNCYGMSEIGRGTQTPISYTESLENCLTVGKALPNIEIKIIDDQQNSLPANHHGEMCFRGPQVTPGYLDNDFENSKLFTSDGFLKSGDIGYYDDNNFFYVVGRIKEIIVVDATKIFPSELEEILRTHPAVENAAVIGVKHEVHNEVPFAFVTLQSGSTVSEKEIIEYFDSKVNYYKKLRGGFKIINSFPMTSLRKINKTQLRQLIQA